MVGLQITHCFKHFGTALLQHVVYHRIEDILLFQIMLLHQNVQGFCMAKEIILIALSTAYDMRSVNKRIC